MTTEHQATRTLVKSPPELWDECSDAGSLARHLGEFGEIRITRLEPETTVAWEGEHATGTVLIEPSGWGTRVTLTATTVTITPEVEEAVADEIVETDPIEEEVDAEVEATVAEPDPALASDPVQAGGRLRRLAAKARAVFKARPETEAELVAQEPVEPPEALDPPEAADPPEAVEHPEAVQEPPEALGPPEAEEPPEALAPVEPSEAEPRIDPEAILSAALESLGQAHHRPFSRA